MSLPHAILTSLLEKPCSGAELARRFDKSIGYFWQATHQQIYRELGKLEGSGLIAAVGAPAGRGSQRHYAALPPGKEELVRWTLEQAPMRPVRDELMVRIRATAVLDGVVDLRPEILRHRELHRDALQRYEGIAARDFAGELTRGQELQRAVLQAGIAFEYAWLAWCDDSFGCS